MDCRGIYAQTYCEGEPKECKFECKDSMHCVNGICTTITRDSGEIVSICLDQCRDNSDCQQQEICIGKRIRCYLFYLKYCQENLPMVEII